MQLHPLNQSDTILPPGEFSTCVTLPSMSDRNYSAAGAENIHAWLSRYMTGRPQPPVKRPINYMRWATGITILLGVVTALATASPYILPIIQNRNIWASISLVSILLFTSGHMFNHIRKVPYIAGDGKGGISYFAGGFQNQFGLETQIIAALCKCAHSRTYMVLTLTICTTQMACSPSAPSL